MDKYKNYIIILECNSFITVFNIFITYICFILNGFSIKMTLSEQCASLDESTTLIISKVVDLSSHLAHIYI